MTNLRITFVDDEPALLEGLRNQFRRERKRWDMSFATGGEEAINMMRAQPPDVVFSDMRMPGMDGAQLLTHVKHEHPRAARIVLSGHAEREAVMRALPVTHQYVHKPCDAEVLRAIIERTHLLRSLLCHPTLPDVVGNIDRLPSVPGTYAELVSLAGDPSSNIGAFASVVERDSSMSAKVLQLVNSAYFGLAQRVVSVKHATTLLGIEVIKCLVLGSNTFYNASLGAESRARISELQLRATLTGRLARAIVEDTSLADAAFTSGLLHHVGQIVLMGAAPDATEAARAHALSHHCPRDVAEREVLGVSHAEIGAHLLGLWGLPGPIVEAVAFHHRPFDVPGGMTPLVRAVHIANALIDEALDGSSATRIDPRVLASPNDGVELDRHRRRAAELVCSANAHALEKCA